jgi:hypothetical protein
MANWFYGLDGVLAAESLKYILELRANAKGGLLRPLLSAYPKILQVARRKSSRCFNA